VLFFCLTVQLFIQEEVKKGIPRSRIIVGGFSQGGATALYSLLAFPQEPVAGIVALSSWLPLHKHFPRVCLLNHSVCLYRYLSTTSVPLSWKTKLYIHCGICIIF